MSSIYIVPQPSAWLCSQLKSMGLLPLISRRTGLGHKCRAKGNGTRIGFSREPNDSSLSILIIHCSYSTQGYSTPLQSQSKRFWSKIFRPWLALVKERFKEYGARSNPYTYIYQNNNNNKVRLGPRNTLLHILKAIAGHTHILCTITEMNALFQEMKNPCVPGHICLDTTSLSLKGILHLASWGRLVTQPQTWPGKDHTTSWVAGNLGPCFCFVKLGSYKLRPMWASNRVGGCHFLFICF